MHLWVALAVLVLGRAGRVDNRGIDNGALAQGETFFLQVTDDNREDCGR